MNRYSEHAESRCDTVIRNHPYTWRIRLADRMVILIERNQQGRIAREYDKAEMIEITNRLKSVYNSLYEQKN